ncbi:hypothetical protein K438DRAFT_2001380 [Mycena galopus ATCC 62051]|nr:hypothetical protein K438DRAFT_2001380 [Mycena galopus ATCC 62051]
MSDSAFEQTKRVAVACSNCRERKIKCMADPQQGPCMRCERNGLDCVYVSTEKQKARGTGSKTQSHNPGHPPSRPFTQGPPTNQNPPQQQFYGGYGNSGPSAGQYPAAVHPSGGNPYSNNNPTGNGSAYRPNSRTYPSVPNYTVPAQYPPGTPYQNGPNMQPAIYPGTAPPQSTGNSGYPMNHANHSYNWNTSNQPR